MTAGALGAPPDDGHRRPDHDRADLVRDRYARIYGEGDLPVPVEAIAEDLLGLRVVAADLGHHAGHVVSGVLKVGQRLLWVAANEPPERRRFTIAHEIGHWECHRHEQGQLCLFDDRAARSDPREREANTFAATLLMPAEPVAAAWEHLCSLGGDHDDRVARLAARFAVSLPAMEWRLFNLGLAPPPRDGPL